MNIYDYILIFLLVAAVVAAVVYMVRRKKSGRCIGCSGDCSACPYKNRTEKNKH